jgi:hypothetical protein
MPPYFLFNTHSPPVHLYIFNSLYILLILRRSACYILHGVTHTDALSVIYFRYTARPIWISRYSGGYNKLPDDGRPLPKHVGAST